ncbi:MAG: hypothetical protein HOP15_07045 [Planctomycetes bacterium]|nr:hypothetical protein [Planctomycetota bacterium]
MIQPQPQTQPQGGAAAARSSASPTRAGQVPQGERVRPRLCFLSARIPWRGAEIDWEGFEREQRRIAALGDMLELGGEAARLHAETAAAAGAESELWVTGTFAGDWARGAREAGRTARVFGSREALREALHAALADGVVVLVKASRGARFEFLLEGLEAEG